jgi:prenyltransferase beta subunit
MLPLVFVDDNAANASADQVSALHYICMMRLCSRPERMQLRMLVSQCRQSHGHLRLCTTGAAYVRIWGSGQSVLQALH